MMLQYVAKVVRVDHSDSSERSPFVGPDMYLPKKGLRKFALSL